MLTMRIRAISCGLLTGSARSWTASINWKRHPYRVPGREAGRITARVECGACRTEGFNAHLIDRHGADRHAAVRHPARYRDAHAGAPITRRTTMPATGAHREE